MSDRTLVAVFVAELMFAFVLTYAVLGFATSEEPTPGSASDLAVGGGALVGAIGLAALSTGALHAATGAALPGRRCVDLADNLGLPGRPDRLRVLRRHRLPDVRVVGVLRRVILIAANVLSLGADGVVKRMTSTEERIESAKQLYGRWMNELWAGQPVADELVSEDFVGHWPDREVHGPDELASIIDKTRTMLTDLRFVHRGRTYRRRGSAGGSLDRYGGGAGRPQAIHRQRHPQVRRRSSRRVLDRYL